MLIDTLKYLEFDELTTAQRNELKRTLRKERQVLQAAIKARDQLLEALERKPRAKRSVKRRTGKRSTKR
jgi:hypothetical protein